MSREISQSNKNEDVVDKFRTYRMVTESKERNLKECKTVIDQLKDDLNFSRDVEKNLRSQISSAQFRLLLLQENFSKLLAASEQQRQNEKISQQIEQKVQQLQEIVRESQKELENLLRSASNQLELIKENEGLKSLLKSKDSQCDLMKIEVQSLTKEKKALIEEFQGKIQAKDTELSELKREKTEIKAECDKTLLIYKRQIEDNEKLIKDYERERKSILEEFAPPMSSTQGNYFVSADSTVSINTDERAMFNPKHQSASQMEPQDETENQLFQCSTYSGVKPSVSAKSKLVSFKKEKGLPRVGTKKKPQLDFLLPSQESSQRTEPQVAPKRRLFSTNCNHYLN